MAHNHPHNFAGGTYRTRDGDRVRFKKRGRRGGLYWLPQLGPAGRTIGGKRR